MIHHTRVPDTSLSTTNESSPSHIPPLTDPVTTTSSAPDPSNTSLIQMDTVHLSVHYSRIQSLTKSATFTENSAPPHHLLHSDPTQQPQRQCIPHTSVSTTPGPIQHVIHHKIGDWTSRETLFQRRSNTTATSSEIRKPLHLFLTKQLKTTASPFYKSRRLGIHCRQNHRMTRTSPSDNKSARRNEPHQEHEDTNSRHLHLHIETCTTN